MVESERSRAPEAKRLHGNRDAPELIGHLLVTGEANEKLLPSSTLSQERSRVRKTEFVEPLSETKIETMNHAELLKLSEKVFVEGNSLRKIYETHLVGEQGLRRLMAEHNRGGDVKKALKQEILEREIEFERDPILRDKVGASTASLSDSKSDTSTALKQMISMAVAGEVTQEEELAFYKAKSSYEVKESAREKKQRKTIDVVIVSTVAVLMVLIALLYLSRH